jgi:CHAD domain-containing protein
VAYAIERTETLHGAVQRIMDEQIVRARDTLDDPKAPAAERVHDARKRFKEIRALLRLVREPLGDQFAHENASFRDAARDLAAARDADAVIEALDKLALPRTVAKRARKVIDAQRASHPPLEPIIENVLEQLVIAHGRLGMWPQLDDSFDTIAPGLLRTYREGRRGMRTHRDAEELHEWRKRVKEHWYHAQLLRHVWPEMMKPYADVLSTLSKALGDHHDLHVLRDLVPELADVIDARQAELEQQAMSIGRRVYAEKPEAWLARMRNTWKAWIRTAP